MLPQAAALREMQEAVEAHYERPELYEEPELSRLEDRLEAALELLRGELSARVTLIPDAGRKSIREWKAALDAAPVDAAMLIFDAAKFSRLMKGRLRFYGSAPEHFDTDWLIENELGRMRRSFVQTPMEVYWRLRTGERAANVMEMIPRLVGEVLTPEEADSIVRFNRLFDEPRSTANRRRIALDVAEVFDGFFHALSKIVADARRRVAEAA